MLCRFVGEAEARGYFVEDFLRDFVHQLGMFFYIRSYGVLALPERLAFVGDPRAFAL